jgi:hypothetical protein
MIRLFFTVTLCGIRSFCTVGLFPILSPLSWFGFGVAGVPTDLQSISGF